MSKIAVCLYLAGFAVVAVLWSIAAFIVVLLAKDIIKPRT